MAIVAPFNVRIIDPNEYILKRNCLPVTSHAIYEPSSSRFHPDGFFSEVIFGQVGSSERLVKRGYVDLHAVVIQPHIWKQLMTLKGFYQDICASKTYAIFDKDLKDLVRVDKKDPKGETGYSFFCRMLPKIEFSITDSLKRSEKIDLIARYSKVLFMDKLIVLPAGVRDVKQVDNRVKPEEINKYYMGVLSLSQAMPATPSDNPIYDSLRYQMQMKIMSIYNYIADLLDGKGGFAQAKYASRSIVYANRNVVSAAPVTNATSPDADNLLKADEVMVPIYQAMKGAEPLCVNKLRTIFFDRVFNSQSTKVPVINPVTFGLEYQDIDPSEMRKFTTPDGIKTFIEDLRNKELHFQPVTVQTKGLKANQQAPYLELVYDDPDTNSIYTFRNLADFMTFYTKDTTYSTKNAENLKRLAGFKPDQFLVLGSTALTVYGMNHYNQDVDIIVSEDVMKEIRKSPDYVKQPNKVYRRKDNGIDVYNDLILAEEKTTFEKYREQHCFTVDGIVFVKPAYLLDVYLKSDRPKDREKIKYLYSIVPDKNKIRPMTLVEMCYIAAYAALHDKHTTLTRYPILNLEGIQIYKLHVTTTERGRQVTLKSLTSGDQVTEIKYPEYPKLDSFVKTTLSPHPSSLESYGCDFDGESKS